MNPIQPKPSEPLFKLPPAGKSKSRNLPADLGLLVLGALLLAGIFLFAFSQRQKTDLPAPPPAVPAPAPAPALKGYVVQLVTYLGEKRAAAAVETLGTKEFRAFVMPDGKFFKVCLGPYAERPEAVQKLSEVRSAFRGLYRDAFVRYIDRPAS